MIISGAPRSLKFVAEQLIWEFPHLLDKWSRKQLRCFMICDTDTFITIDRENISEHI